MTVALCFLGHGAWGLIGKAAWVPYFTAAGVSESAAWTLMPLIGVHDFVLGLFAVARPHRGLLGWMTAWCVWTACLRPMAGESGFEFFERAGNFGPPLALVLMLPSRSRWLEPVLRGSLAMLLLGHAGLAFPVGKPLLLAHWHALGVTSPGVLGVQAAIELVLATLVLAWRSSPVPLVATLCWKLFTESLHVVVGPPVNVFEFIERAGDFGLPVALLLFERQRDRQA